jgi:hypothetical protein
MYHIQSYTASRQPGSRETRITAQTNQGAVKATMTARGIIIHGGEVYDLASSTPIAPESFDSHGFRFNVFRGAIPNSEFTKAMRQAICG